MAEMEYVTAKTSVWWDIDNYEVPKGLDAHTIAKNVSLALLKMNYCGPVSISAYGDTNLIPHAIQQALSSTGVGLNHVPTGVKDASDKKILVDILLWSADNPAPANFMLISGDRDFSYALHQLRMRRYNILLAQPPQASVPPVAAAKNVWLWTSLASGGPPLTSVESSPLLNNGRYEVSKHPVSEQAQSSKPTDSTSVALDTKDHKDRENHVPRGSPQETRRNMLQNDRGATSESFTACRISSVVCDSFAHLSDKKHISQAAFVDSRRAQASVSAKPIQEAELVEPVWCKVCEINCTSKDTYKIHTYGKRHQNNLELQSGKSKKILVGPVEPPKEILEHQKKKKKKASVGRAKPNAYRVCRLCNVVCHSQIVFDSHMRGKKHASMLSQSEALIDSKKRQEKGVSQKDQPKETIAERKPNADHVCCLCNVVCQSQIVFDSHLKGQKHAAMLSQSEALIDSKKLQEKGVGEKDQPRETIAEPLLHSPNAQENKKCFEKHVVMVNQSEALINSRKREENVFREKAQLIETVAENQSQSQNTQENTNFFEKKNEEFIGICGTSESSIKELFPSTKDRVDTVNKPLPNGEFVFGDLRCDFEVPRETRVCFNGIVKSVNLSEQATEHLREVKKKQKEMMVRLPRPAGSKRCNRCVVSFDRLGLSTVVCDNKGHWTNQKHTTAAASVAIDDSLSSVSTKPIKEPEVLQPVWCQVCQIICSSKVAYANHTYEKKHQQKLELQSAKNENMSTGPAKLSKENAEKKKVLCKNQTAFDSQMKSQNHAAMVKEQVEALVDSRRTRQKIDQEKPREALEQALIVDSRKIREESSEGKETTEEHTVAEIDDLGIRGEQEEKEKVKEINAISKKLEQRVFTDPNRESRIPKESRGCLDVILERVELPPDVNVIEKLEDESSHKPEPKSWEPENESAGPMEHPGEAAKMEEIKGQVENFWTRLWGKKS